MTSSNTRPGYSEAGGGDPVVLLDWTPWESRVLADSLAASYRVLSLDPPAQAESADNLATAVIKATEAAGLSSYVLVGTSLGADVALHLALTQPSSVSVLVAVSPTCVAPSATRPWHTPELAASAMLAHPDAPGATPADPVRTAALSSLAERWQAAANTSKRLAELSCATLVVFGQEDRLVSREAGGIWKAEVPNCSLSYVYDAGHAIAVDRPDALANVVLDFVERRETFIVENRPSVINP